MQNQTVREDHMTGETQPLERLTELLGPDMKQVNELILKSMESEVPLIPKLAHYLIAAGGKRIRPLLTLACAKAVNAPMHKAYPLAAAVEFIHTATLLHDDVVDESSQRRGQKAANIVFGNQASVLVGDFLFSKSFQLMVDGGSLEILRILSNAAATIAQGEVMQLTTANDIKTTMESYLNVISGKTAALFAASCEVGPVLAAVSPAQISAAREYGTNIGIAFQIVDDALDYSADQNKLGKTVGDDFREGKMTAPVIFSLQEATQEEKDFWSRTIGQKKQNNHDLETAISIMKKRGALEKTMTLAKSYSNKAKESLNQFPACEIASILDDLAQFTISRGF